jgi:hypothetical protein
LAAVGAAQQEEQEDAAAFFFEVNMQWPLAQLLSRMLVETRARVRINFMMVWCKCLETSEGQRTHAQQSEGK